MKLDELVKGSGNKLWYDLEFNKTDLTEGNKQKVQATVPAEIQLLPVFVPRSKIIEEKYNEKNSEEVYRNLQKNSVKQDEFNSERK